MIKRIMQIINFLKVGIWHVKRKDVSTFLYFFYGVIKKVILAVERATTKRMVNSASALTYSTLLAIVPIMAVVFAIARGFGYNKYIEDWFRETTTSCRNNNRIRQFVPGPYKERHIPGYRTYIHVMDGYHAY